MTAPRGRGRPPVGPVVEVRLGDLKARVDAEAARTGQSQSATIRALLTEALDAREVTRRRQEGKQP